MASTYWTMNSRSPKFTLVTGATGFLGSLLVKEMVRRGERVIVLKRSTSSTARLESVKDALVFYDSDKAELDSVFEKHPVDRIVHCATNYGREKELPSKIIEANLMLPLRLLQLAPEYGVREFINTDTVLPKHLNYYALSKKQFLDWMVAFSPNLSCINVSLEHFYGPGDNRTKFVTDLILSMLEGTPKLNFTAGEQKRDFIFIDDVIQAFFVLFEHFKNRQSGFESFEVGSGQSISIKDFVLLTARLCGCDDIELNFGVIPYRDGEVMESRVNIQPLLDLGWRAETSLQDGLLRTIEHERPAPADRVTLSAARSSL